MPDSIRTVISCDTSHSAETASAMAAILQDDLSGERRWWPPMPQSDQVVQDQCKRILAQVSPEHRPIAEQFFTCMVYNRRLDTWGLVSCPNGFGGKMLEIRLVNPDADKLKKACEDLVVALEAMGKRDGLSVYDFDNYPEVAVYPPKSSKRIFTGIIVQASEQHRRKQLRERKRRRIRTAWLMTSLTVILLVLGFAIFASAPKGVWHGFWSRLAIGLAISSSLAAIQAWLQPWLQPMGTEDQKVILWS